ncbi:860_t:CDS:2 [Paraglomus occultum]|uniref:858_t:CDS:1 n=1 Tax=Paraglomus occultum TaxID=144539 RepID=A0A9N9EWA6_9GLOM|nr:858_t:CDS:2 [Paraglomus occultum]CAG8496346.1 860_t:CDS:2 [Paraglomus occultum]
MSSPSVSSPISESSTIAEESTRTVADVIRKYKTEEPIDYLRRQEYLHLKDSHFKIIRQEEISGFDFLETTKEKFRSYGLKAGPAKRLAAFVENLEQKMRSSSSHKTLDELKNVLRKYKINDTVEIIVLKLIIARM